MRVTLDIFFRAFNYFFSLKEYKATVEGSLWQEKYYINVLLEC